MNRKRFFLALLMLIMTLSVLAREVTIDGINYRINGDSAVVIKGDYSGDIIIPSSVLYQKKKYYVVTVGDYAFQYCRNLKSITIEYGVKTIGGDAFYNCDKLKKVSLPNSIKTIKSDAFRGCDSITTIKIPNSVVEIGSGAFSGCDLLNNITLSSSLKSIDNSTFNYCSALKSISIPNGVVSIGEKAFSGCRRLINITIPSSVTSIGKCAFEACDALVAITIPKSVTEIEGNVFKDCDSLKSIAVENGNKCYDSRNNCNAIIKTSSNALIAGCKNSIIPNGVKTVGDYAFYSCDELTDIKIPNSVTEIGEYAFCYCYRIKDIAIPNSVRVIGKSAFDGCSALSCIVIPSSVEVLGNSAFSCKYVSVITVDKNNKVYDSRGGCNAIIDSKTNVLVLGCKNTEIPNDVVEIGDYAFYHCDSLTGIILPNSVTKIGSNAFCSCGNLKEITIPSGVESIGSSAFKECYSLKEIAIPSSVKTIGSFAFDYCSGLEKITLPDGLDTIESYTFSSCTRLSHIAIPNGLKKIAEGAFYNMYSLKNISIPDSVTSIGKGAFKGCYNLTSIKLPNGIKILEPSVFYGCKKLIGFSIPDSVQEVKGHAFYSCKSLKDIFIPNGVTKIGGYAFQECDGLSKILIPKSVEVIDWRAFDDCDSLTTVIMSNGSVKIENNAFKYCKSLKYISVPKDFDVKKLDLPKGVKVTHTPILFSELTIDSVKYESASKDGEIHSEEKGYLCVKIRNTSYGKASNAIASIAVTGNTKGIDIPTIHKLGDLAQKKATWVKIPVAITKETTNGKICVKVKVKDDYGVKSNEIVHEIVTHRLPIPELNVTSHVIRMENDTILSKTKNFEIVLTLKNIGEISAYRHEMSIIVPDGMIMYGQSSISLSEIKPGEEKSVTLKFSSYDNIRNNVALVFDINKSKKEKVESYKMNLEFGKTKVMPKNVLVQSSRYTQVVVDSMVVVGRGLVLQQIESMGMTMSKWAKYSNGYAILKIRITGDKSEVVKKAKEFLNMKLGVNLGVKDIYRGEANEVWFLVSVDATRIILTCGDGPKEIEIWNGELQNNKVYAGEIVVY